MTNEDLVQQALYIIYEKYKTTKFEKGILPWAYTIIENLMMNEYRTAKRRHKKLSMEKEEILENENHFENIIDQVDKQILIDEVKLALRKLSNKQKRIIELRLKGFSGDQIAKMMRITSSDFYVSSHRAINELKRILKTRGIVRYEMHRS